MSAQVPALDGSIPLTQITLWLCAPCLSPQPEGKARKDDPEGRGELCRGSVPAMGWMEADAQVEG